MSFTSLFKDLVINQLVDDTKTQPSAAQIVAQNTTSVFWGILVKFASAMTFGYTLVILFIFLHDFDEDSDFAARRRYE